MKEFISGVLMLVSIVFTIIGLLSIADVLPIVYWFNGQQEIVPRWAWGIGIIVSILLFCFGFKISCHKQDTFPNK